MAYPRPTYKRLVRQSAAIHPDWTVHDHISYLRDNEGYDISSLGPSPADTVQRWLDEFSETNKLIQHLVRDHGWMQSIDPSDASTVIAQHNAARGAKWLPGCQQFPVA